MADKIKVGIIGCGGIANAKHLPSLAHQSHRLEIVAFCDIIQERAEKAAKQYGKVGLMPIAVNYFFLRDNRPEVMVEMGEIIELEAGKVDRKGFTEQLAKTLESLCDRQMYDISQANFAGYKTLFQQRLKWYRRIEQRLKNKGLRKKA